MSRQTKTFFYLSCDECPPDEVQTSNSIDDFSMLEADARQDDWAIEGDATTPYDVCPRCLKRRRQRACGERPQGHNWRKTWFAGEAGEDGWIWIAMDGGPGRPAGNWQRHCLDCLHSDYVLTEREPHRP